MWSKRMKEVAEKCVSSARNVAEGNPTLGKLLKKGENPLIKKTHYEFAAVIREAVNQLQYYQFGTGEDAVVSARVLFELAEELENL